MLVPTTREDNYRITRLTKLNITMTSGLEMKWDYFGKIKGRDGQKKKIGKANVKREKQKSKKKCKR